MTHKITSHTAFSHSQAGRNTRGAWFVLLAGFVLCFALPAAEPAPLEAGIAVEDITPPGPIRLAGYAARTHPSEKVDTPLSAQAIAFRHRGGEPFIFIALDNCEVSHDFMQPIVAGISAKYHLPAGAVMVVSSHTHSAPVLARTLVTMYELSAEEKDRIEKYSADLQDKLINLAGTALQGFQPALLEQGVGRATFAMNRRIYQAGKVTFGENPEGPVDWDVPVLAVKGTNNALRAILFGYACHGTSIQGADFYIVSGDYMAYTRQHLEQHYPGAKAIYLTGMGADSNPSPRGSLLDAKRHGLELAGAVVSVLNRPMQPITGALRYAFGEAELPFVDPPPAEKLAQDAQSSDVYIRKRAQLYQQSLREGRPLPASLKLPLAAIRIGNDALFLAMGGEVVVDYAHKLNRIFARERPWLIGYAYEVPCYIPSQRILLEGGYEADSSLIYYGIYGPFRGTIEEILLKKMAELAQRAANP